MPHNVAVLRDDLVDWWLGQVDSGIEAERDWTFESLALLAAGPDASKRHAVVMADESLIDGYLEIPLAAWDLTAFSRSSPLLWAHATDEPPIGQVFHPHVTDTALVGEIAFSGLTPRSREVAGIWPSGTLGVSPGFRVTKTPEVVRVKGRAERIRLREGSALMRELSVTPVPRNPNALGLASPGLPSAAPAPPVEEPSTPDYRARLAEARQRFTE